MAASTVLQVENARKSYGSTAALQGAAMHLRSAEWLGLLGPNGAGKTTLIRAIAGRVKLDEGSVSLLGHRLNGMLPEASQVRQDLGIVPQEIALYPLLTARENLRVFGELHGLRGSVLKERVTWALEWTGLGDRAESLVKTFSGGMQRRLNIACGVLHEPKVLLLDEPTVGVDPQSRMRIWEMLSELKQRGASLLLTTHQLDEAQQVCDRITIIDNGRTIADGTLDELIVRTIGRRRRVTLTLGCDASQANLSGLTLLDSTRVCGDLNDVAAELPGMLQKVKAAGATVEDVRVEAPNLQAVFIHLTGRELRE